MIAVSRAAPAAVVGNASAMLACPRCGSTYLRDVVFCGLDGERLAQVDYDPLIGQTIDRYRIDAILGDGGMARVYRATHVHLGQPCAVKVLYGDMATDRALAERFRREAQSSASIKHPNVVSVVDFGVTPEGLSFMAMELLEGSTLSEDLDAAGRFTAKRAAYVIRQIALGLAAAHTQGFVHRDLKPKNVMLVPQPEGELAKILDFGLVRPVEEVDNRLTAKGQVFGTPAYMAPEQITDGDVDARADLYALGAILYELLSGKPPFTGQMTEVFRKHLSVPPTPLDDPSGLGELAIVLLSKSPSARPDSAEKVVALVEGLQIERPSTPPKVVPRKPSQSKPPARTTSKPPSSEVKRGAPDPLAVELFHSIELNEHQLRAIADRSRPAWITPLVAICVVTAILVGIGLWRTTRIEPIPPPQQIAAPQKEPPPIKAPAPPPPPPVAEPKEPLLQVEPKKDPPIEAPKPEPKPAPKEEPPKEEPAAEPELPLGAVPPFEDLDRGLLWAVSQRGLNLRDLSLIEPDASMDWIVWKQQGSAPDPKALIVAYEALRAAASMISIDEKLLHAKIDRIRHTIDRVPGEKRGDKLKAASETLKDLSKQAKSANEDDRLVISGQLTMLEATVEELVPSSR
jgi:serine/threonine protein kinase